eukprot:Colp12_sorted_trinity150504_noHs@18425
MANKYKEYLDAAVSVAREGGAIIKAAFHKAKNITSKSSSVDLVTETDQKVEKVIIETLKTRFPSHKFIGEESVAAGLKSELTDDPTWIIDPLDGTTNFVHRFPFVAVSIGLAIQKQVVVGVVYNCILDELYTAVKGEGAQLNGEAIHVSGVEEVGSALIGTEFGSNRQETVLEKIRHNMFSLASPPDAAHSIRCLGSAALNMCHVAKGAMDAYFEMGIHCWDIAAGAIIVQEAGGFVSNVDLSPLEMMTRQVLCAGTQTLASNISANISFIEFERD